MGNVDEGLSGLADYLQARRADILSAWRTAIQRDPALTTSASLPRADLYDHIPALLATFEQQLRKGAAASTEAYEDIAQEPAAAHGLQRWKQGYDLREVTRELGKLNETVVAELESYNDKNSSAAREARRMWAVLCSTGIEESVGQYFNLQQQEAAGQARDLESALAEIKLLEQQRGDLWRQAAHDLRGNLGVVANATVGLTQGNLHEPARDAFVRILMRNVTSLHHLLNDVTDLARLQAGREERHIEPIDVSPLLTQLCEGARPLAQQHRLFLLCEGPAGFGVDGDAVKIRRIAQNLVLNAVKFTREGGITVSWGDSDAADPKRWQLCIRDTGPGFATGSDKPLTQALEKVPDRLLNEANGANQREPAQAESKLNAPTLEFTQPHSASGEGLGLSIVKRLCDMLDATIEVDSELGVGTTFRIRFPRHYST
ncbi:MAG: sensor histidine kinase [Pseudomonadota bacterium]|nr:sensor histidine kinase [Pseudomonadota bacterium]